MDLEEIVRRIASIMECTAKFSFIYNDSKCCELLRVTLSPSVLSKSNEVIHIGAASGPLNVPFERVRLYLNLNNNLTLRPVMDDLIRMALEPYLKINRLHLIVHDSSEGLEISLIDDNRQVTHNP